MTRHSASGLVSLCREALAYRSYPSHDEDHGEDEGCGLAGSV